MALTYDVHSHIGLDGAFWSAGWWPYASTAQDQLQHMAATGIDRAVCFPFGTPTAFDYDRFRDDRELVLRDGRFPFDEENPNLLQEVDRIDTANRLLPFAMFDPSRKIAEQQKALEGMVDRVSGLKTQATILRSQIRDLLDKSSCFMELAAANDLPVVIHTSIAKADLWSQVRDCLDVAEAFPKVRFNLAHSLRFDEPMLREAATRDNVWVDCSAHLAHCALAVDNIAAVALKDRRVDADYTRPSEVLQAIYAILGEKYIWGSDNPFMSWCDDGIALIFSYEKEMEVLRGAGDKIVKSMLTDGPVAWLGSKAR